MFDYNSDNFLYYFRHQMKSLQYEINSLTKDMDWTLYNLYLAEITELVKVYLFL